MPESAGGPDRGLREFELTLRVQSQLARVFLILGDISQWPTEQNPRMLVRKDFERVTIAFDDMTRASVKFLSAGEATQILVLHELCKSQEQVDSWRNYWFTLMESLKSRLGA